MLGLLMLALYFLATRGARRAQMGALPFSTCSICKQKVQRDKSGRMLMHTRTEYIGLKPIAIVCNGSDRGARP